MALDVGFAQRQAQLAEEGRPGAVGGGFGDEGDDRERGGRLPPQGFEEPAPFARVGQDDVDLQPVEDVEEVLAAEMGIEGRVEDVIEEAGQVGAGALDPVVGEDGDPRRLASADSPPAGGQRVEGGGHHPGHAADLLVAPLRRQRRGHVLEEDLAGMGLRTRPEEIEEGKAADLKPPEYGLGPAAGGILRGQA